MPVWVGQGAGLPGMPHLLTWFSPSQFHLVNALQRMISGCMTAHECDSEHRTCQHRIRSLQPGLSLFYLHTKYALEVLGPISAHLPSLSLLSHPRAYSLGGLDYTYTEAVADLQFGKCDLVQSYWRLSAT